MVQKSCTNNKAIKGLNIIRILDSMNFLPMTLSALLEEFGIEKLLKRIFPPIP